MTVNIALLGAGIFAREEYIPALANASNANLVAIYSRSKRSVEKLASEIGKALDIYYDDPPEHGRGLDSLLKRDDVEAVIAALPITVQPEAVKKAMTAGKHVLSEKPLAAHSNKANDQLQHFRRLQNPLIWMVAENFRYLEVLTYARTQITELQGDIVSFHVNVFAFVDENDKFYQTEWRQKPDYQGGFLLDGGVHFIAGLRHLLAGLEEDVTSVAAFTSLVQPKLAPVDTIHAILATTRGRSGTFSVSFGSQHRSTFEIAVTTTRGSVSVTPTAVVVTDVERKEVQKEFQFSSGVAQELEGFVTSIQTGKLDARGAPEEAERDLAIIESMLTSAQEGGQVKHL